MAARVLPAIEGVTITHAVGPVALAGCLTVVARHGFAAAPPSDVTIVCGGPGWRRRSRMPLCSPSCAASIRLCRLGLHRRAHPRCRRPARLPRRHNPAPLPSPEWRDRWPLTVGAGKEKTRSPADRRHLIEPPPGRLTSNGLHRVSPPIRPCAAPRACGRGPRAFAKARGCGRTYPMRLG
jgi:hypothetical protein